jgi:hypothetical protein
VRGYCDVANRREIRVRIGRQVVAAKTIDPAFAKLTRRQTDAVHDDQVERRVGGSLILVRRNDAAHAVDPARSLDRRSRELEQLATVRRGHAGDNIAAHRKPFVAS